MSDREKEFEAKDNTNVRTNTRTLAYLFIFVFAVGGALAAFNGRLVSAEKNQSDDHVAIGQLQAITADNKTDTAVIKEQQDANTRTLEAIWAKLSKIEDKLDQHYPSGR